MSKTAKSRLSLLMTIVAGLLCAMLIAYYLLQNSKVAVEWPASLHQPLLIPTQQGFAPSGENNQPTVEAKKAWRHVLSQFRSASSDAAAVATTAPLLRDIWTRWPNSSIAVQAQLIHLETLEAYGSDEIGLEQILSFVEHAIQMPDLYFSREFQASTQTVAIRAIHLLHEGNSEAQALKLCFKLRWLAPRIDLIAPICQSTIADATEITITPNTALEMLSDQVAISEIPVAKLTLPLVITAQNYLSRPYDANALSKFIIELYKQGFEEISDKLLLEMLQIDPVKMPKTEMAIDKLKINSNALK